MSKPDKPSPAPPETEEGGFLARWSRRKAEAREAKPEAPAVAPAAEAEDEVFDPATLPSIDDLTVDSDFSLFLKKGVPTALRAAALRKLWLIEPSVVNYQPLVEYNWDFTAPGYGELLPTDDVAKMLRTVLEGTRATEAPVTADEVAGEMATEPPHLAAPADEPVVALQPEEAATPEAEPAGRPDEAPLPRRRHGGALPS